jgi:hypothetical protein
MGYAWPLVALLGHLTPVAPFLLGIAGASVPINPNPSLTMRLDFYPTLAEYLKALSEESAFWVGVTQGTACYWRYRRGKLAS